MLDFIYDLSRAASCSIIAQHASETCSNGNFSSMFRAVMQQFLPTFHARSIVVLFLLRTLHTFRAVNTNRSVTTEVAGVVVPLKFGKPDR